MIMNCNGDDDNITTLSSEKHGGSFSLEEVVACTDYARKIATVDTKKRKWALNFGYLGSNYQGLQMNPQADTVEKHVEKALYLAGSIAESNFTDLHKIQWTRTARTDRGVHAVMQCCAMKLLVSPDSRDQFIREANSFLPSDIRIHSMTKVTKNFNSKLQCTKRRYHYLLPTYMLQDKAYISEVLNKLMSSQSRTFDAGLAGGYADLGSDKFLSQSNLRTARNYLKEFRLESSRLEFFRAALKFYEGTKKYHNFTSDKHPSDANSSRYIISFQCGEPFLDPGSDSEWILLSVVGQSFLLNQIRKMIGLACEVATGHVGLDTMATSVSDKKVDIPMAPGVGLYLDELYFENYNKNQEKTINEKLNNKNTDIDESHKNEIALKTTVIIIDFNKEENTKMDSSSLFISKEIEQKKSSRITEIEKKEKEEEFEAKSNIIIVNEEIVKEEVEVVVGVEVENDQIVLQEENKKHENENENEDEEEKKSGTNPSTSLPPMIPDIVPTPVSVNDTAPPLSPLPTSSPPMTSSKVNSYEGKEEANVDVEVEVEIANEPSVGEMITWTLDPTTNAVMTAFREGTIWPHILHEDEENLHFMYYMDYLRVHRYKYLPTDFKEKSQKKDFNDSRNNRKGGRGGKGKEKKELWEAKKRQKIEDSKVSHSLGSSGNDSQKVEI